jgi:glycosyltransferase involved in cell wall biosynthesis
VLAQQGDFELEIIVGEDCSTDNTRAVCQEYAARYPGTIRLFLRNPARPKWHISGRQTGRYNLLENLQAARGQYIAMLDGDDYWTDPGKLQAQLSYLQANPGCSLVFTRSTVHRADGSLVYQWPRFMTDQVATYTHHQFCLGNPVGENTGSVLYRAQLLEGLTTWPWIWQVSAFDWPLWVWLTRHHWAACLPQITLYRRHAGGMWDGLNAGRQLIFMLDLFGQVRQHMGLPTEDLQALEEGMLDYIADYAKTNLQPRPLTLREQLYAVKRAFVKMGE